MNDVSKQIPIMAQDIELETLTVATIAKGLSDGTFTAEELTIASLAQVAKLNDQYTAIVFENPDAIETAKAIDAKLAAGEVLGPLAGVPIVVKDPMDMKGFPTTAGWHLLYSKTGGVDLFPERDSPVVARMRAADAVILGKTNVPVLSHTGSHANDSWAGPTINVVLEDRLPGGSSAGTASAVACQMCVLGLAEETGGSIQNPASAHGLVGIKPTMGLVPNAGVVPLSGNRDVVGPIARNVHDAAICLDALAGWSAEDPKTLASVGNIPKDGYASLIDKDALRGKKLGLYGKGWRPDVLSDETIELYENTKIELENAGAILIDDPFAQTSFSSLREPTFPSKHFDGRGLESIAWDVNCYLQRLGPNAAIKTWDEFSEAVKSEDPFSEGGVLSFMDALPDFKKAMENPTEPPELPEFIALKAAYLSILADVFERFELDGLVYPQMCDELPALHSGSPILETTVGELNIAGIPAVTVPAGYYKSGAPFELIFLGLQWSEAELIAMAYAYEQSTMHRKPAV